MDARWFARGVVICEAAGRVPATMGPAWEVGGGGVGMNRAGARYLEDMARTVAVTLLTLTPRVGRSTHEAVACSV